MKKAITFTAIALVLLLSQIASAQYLQFHPIAPNSQPTYQQPYQQHPIPYQQWQVPVPRPQPNPYDQQRNQLSPPGSYTNPYYVTPVQPDRYESITGSGYR